MSDEHVPLEGYAPVTDKEMREQSAAMLDMLLTRETAIKAAATAPNGANQQPWHFAAISNPEMKRKIRLAAEEEERAFYGGRASEEWLEALAPLGTDASKPFLETAPWLIACFAQKKGPKSIIM